MKKTSKKETVKTMLKGYLTVIQFNNLIKSLDKEPSEYNTSIKQMCEKRIELMERVEC